MKSFLQKSNVSALRPSDNRESESGIHSRQHANADQVQRRETDRIADELARDGTPCSRRVVRGTDEVEDSTCNTQQLQRALDVSFKSPGRSSRACDNWRCGPQAIIA